MHFKQKILISLTTFLLLFLASCNMGIDEPENLFTVSFYEDDTKVLSLQVQENCNISSSSDYSQLKNYKSSTYASFILEGWYTKDGRNSSNIIITEDTDFYASYAATVNFYSRNHDNIQSTKTFTIGKTLNDSDYPEVTPYKSESITYNFLYWSENKDATPETRKNDEFKHVITKNKGTINLYPIFTSLPLFKITFYTDPKKEPLTRYYSENDTIENYISPSDYKFDYYTTFLYWSESRANEAEAQEKKFDTTTPITKDLTLYGIYTPYLLFTDKLENTLFKIYFFTSSSGVYKFEDGSIPDLKVTYKTDNSDYIPLQIKSIDIDETSTSNNCYVTYYFDPLPANISYTFKIANSSDEATKIATFYEPAPVTNIKATVKDSYAKVEWTIANGYSNYTVKAMNGTTVEQTITFCSTSAEFYGLKNDVEYTFVVQTGTTDKTAQITATPKITQEESDWVLAMYMDGDNDLNDPIYVDMNEVEYGLYLNSITSIKAVALWDGSSQVTTNKGEDGKPQLNHAGSYIYELGKDSSCQTVYVNDSGCVLSSSTKNLSYTAVEWLTTTTPTSIDKDFYGEVNMGDEKTLENFLNWVKARYKAKKEYILQFSDHGGGPRSVRYIQTNDGHIVKLNEEGRRALCWDESNSNNFLSTKDVATALKNAGYGESNKINMILMDVCLGASIEDAYEFSPYAEYLAASPNNIPGMGIDYTYFIKSLSSSTTIENIGLQLIKDYKDQYHSKENWLKYLNQFYGTNISSISSYSQEDINLASMDSSLGIPTLTFIDLSKVSDLVDSINTFAGLLVNDTTHIVYYEIDSNTGNKLFLPEVTSNSISYSKALGELLLNYPNNLINSMFYAGTYSWLSDIGYLFNNIKSFSASQLSNGTTNIYYWQELNTACDDVLLKCNEAILYSWRDYYNKTSLSNNYYCQDKYDTYDNLVYGLTICGANIATQGDSFVPGSYPDFYDKLNFGKENDSESNWYKLLKIMFGN